MALDALIFDVDGTLLDSMRNQYEWMRHACATLGKTFPFESFDDRFKKEYNTGYRGNGAKENPGGLQGLYAVFGIDYEKEKDLLWREFEPWKRANPPPLIANAVDAVRTISSLYPKLSLALNTTSRRSAFERQMTDAGIIGLFQPIVTEAELPVIDGKKLLKPHPYSVELCLSQLGTEPARTLHVGDTGADVLSSRTATGNVPFAAVTWGDETREELLCHEPEYIIDSPDELVDLIKRLA